MNEATRDLNELKLTQIAADNQPTDNQRSSTKWRHRPAFSQALSQNEIGRQVGSRSVPVQKPKGQNFVQNRRETNRDSIIAFMK